MSCSGGLRAALLLGVVGLLLAGPARSDEETDRKVARLKALVRNEPLAAVLPDDESPRIDYVFHCKQPMERPRLRWEVRRAVRDASLRYAVSRDLIRSVIRQESAYDARALSPAGAMGLMQLMPGTARELGVVCPYDPRENILAGTRYLRELRDRFGSWRLALAAYNAGPTAVDENRVPPITRLYVRRVMAGWRPHFSDGV